MRVLPSARRLLWSPILISSAIFTLLTMLSFSVTSPVAAQPPTTTPSPTPIYDGVYRRLHVPVLMYHYVTAPPASEASDLRGDLSVTAENFMEQMRWLHANNYHTITPDQLMAALGHGAALPARPIMITFDDGYVDAYTTAFPILMQFGFTGVFFVVTDFIDTGKKGYMSWEQARAMAAAGMFIQDHSRTHDDMRRRPAEWLVNQIVPSRDRIEAMTGVRPRYFCYPFGGYDNWVFRELRAAGFVAGFSINDGTIIDWNNVMQIPRVRIRGATTLPMFARLVSWER